MILRRCLRTSLNLPTLCGLALLVANASPALNQILQTPADATLQSGFLLPPPQARLRCYWWWLNGNTTEATIDHDLMEMSRKGFGGVLLVDANGSDQHNNENVPPGPTFASPQWTRLYLHALKTAASLHLEVNLNATSGWNLGGPDVTPADASKLLTWSRVIVNDDGFDGVLPMPPTKNDFYRQIAVLAYPLAHGSALAGSGSDGRKPIRDLTAKSAAMELGISMPHTESLLADFPVVPGEQDAAVATVINLTAQIDVRGHLLWQPPSPGAWEILRVGYTDSDARVSTSSGAWQGLAIDYMDPDAFDTYWDKTLVPLLDASRPYLGTTLTNLATDSWELGGTNWTGRFAAEFKRARGYDAIPYLPIVAGRILDDRATSTRFLNDLRRTVGDLLTGHYDHFAERAKEYGLGIQCESGGPHGAPLDALETFRASAVPQSEFWAQSNEHRSRDEDRYFTKEVASAADIYGKKYAAEEGMTTIGPQWSESPATDLKPSFDQAITEGMNRLVWHQFTSSPASFGLPGNEYFAGTHMNPNVTWWAQSGAFFTYLNRVQYMMQQGHAVDDVLYFYSDEVPNFVRLKSDDPAHILPGYDYDVTDEDALLHSLTWKNGELRTPAGNMYKVLALPAGRRVSLKSLEWIAAYVKQGGTVSGLPMIAPTGITDGLASARFAELAHGLWDGCKEGAHSYGRGMVFCTANTRAALAQMKRAPDFEDKSGKLDYVHRADERNDIYFVRNTTGEELDTGVTFRAVSGEPELWDAVDASVSSAKHCVVRDKRTEMVLHLAPYGSVFVVFDHGTKMTAEIQPLAAGKASVSVTELPASQWTIQFQAARGAPAGRVPLTSLLNGFQSWSEAKAPGVHYFSGTAFYRTLITVALEPGGRQVLALGGLHEICTVRVNGKEMGTIWAMPYRLDITAGLKAGRNSIELEVTNLWPNRLIGDAQPGVIKPFTRTNIRKYTARSPLLPSGLVGNVELETIHKN